MSARRASASVVVFRLHHHAPGAHLQHALSRIGHHAVGADRLGHGAAVEQLIGDGAVGVAQADPRALRLDDVVLRLPLGRANRAGFEDVASHICTLLTFLLDWRTGHRAVGAVDAAIAFLRCQPRAAMPAVVNILARIRRHVLNQGLTAGWTGNGRLQLYQCGRLDLIGGSPLPFARSERRVATAQPKSLSHPELISGCFPYCGRTLTGRVGRPRKPLRRAPAASQQRS